MAECVPGVELAACDLDAIEVVKGDDKIIQIAAAITMAAVKIVTDCDGCVDDQSVTWGSTRAWPNCCNAIQTGIRTIGSKPTGDTESTCYRPKRVRWELLISQCRPTIKGKELPPSGFGDATPSLDSITGHAYHMHRLTQAVECNLLKIVCCLVDPKCLVCKQLKITAVDSDRETCDQVRFTIEAA